MTEHTCENCFYDFVHPLAYPCSMCVCGEERKDMFKPKIAEQTEPQTDCTEALTLLWIKNMVTDEEFYRIDARLKCISCKWWNDTIVGGSECVSKECTYQPKDEPQTDCAWK